MKTVIINGSMRKKGNTAFLIDEFKKIIKGEIIQYNLSELNFTPCINCRCCVRLGHCCIKDDITEVYLNVIDCDALVIASPLYFSQLTGNVLNFMSRAEWVYLLKNNKNGLESKLEVKKKISAVILNGGGNTNLCNDITFPLKEFFHIINAEFVGSVGSLKTEKINSKDDFVCQKEVHELVFRINSILKNK